MTERSKVLWKKVKDNFGSESYQSGGLRAKNSNDNKRRGNNLMPEFYSLITNIGIQKVNEALSSGTNIDLAFIAVGDSNGSYYEPDINQI